VLGVAFAALIVLPLRAIKERTYRCQELSALDGALHAEVDGQYYSMPVRCWFDGLQTAAPFRLRIFYRPNDAREHRITFSRVSLGSHDLEIPRSGGSWYRNRDRNPIAIVGFLEAPLTTDESVLRVEFSIDDRHTFSELRLVPESRVKIVHSGVEALMGI
jgi:hypothetical protein